MVLTVLSQGVPEYALLTDNLLHVVNPVQLEFHVRPIAENMFYPYM